MLYFFSKILKNKILVEENGFCCQTTREKTHKNNINLNFENNLPLTCRANPITQKYSDENELKEINLDQENQEKVQEIMNIYDEKIRNLEGRFFKKNLGSEGDTFLKIY